MIGIFSSFSMALCAVVNAIFKEVEFDIIYGEGISLEGELLDLVETHQLIEKTGTWYSFF